MTVQINGTTGITTPALTSTAVTTAFVYFQAAMIRGA